MSELHDGVFYARQATVALMRAKLTPDPPHATHLWRMSPDVRAALASLVDAKYSAPSPPVGSHLLGYPIAVDDAAAVGTLELEALPT